MFNTQPLRTGFSPLTSTPAHSARARLLNDPALRRNRPVPAIAPATPARASVTFTPLSADLLRPAAGAGMLSRAEQECRARQVAQSFRHHTLADLTYHAEQQITLATLQPSDAAHASDPPHQICVEANGNVSVLHNSSVLVPDAHLVVHRLLLLVGGLTAVVGTLFSLALL